MFTAFGVRLPAVDISRVCAALSLAGGDRHVKSLSHFAAVPTEKAHYAQSVVREASGNGTGAQHDAVRCGLAQQELPIVGAPDIALIGFPPDYLSAGVA